MVQEASTLDRDCTISSRAVTGIMLLEKRVFLYESLHESELQHGTFSYTHKLAAVLVQALQVLLDWCETKEELLVGIMSSG